MMRTARFSGRLGWGEGGLPKGMSATPSVDRQTPVKILPRPKLCLRAVINLHQNNSSY